jgi:hypothetical protein
MLLDMGGGVIVLIVLGVTLVIVGAIVAHLAAKKRRAELAAWAARHGLVFSEGRDSGMDNRYSQFDCLDQGSNRYAFNIMCGRWKGRGFLAFDYHYATHSTNSKGEQKTHHHYFSAAIIEPDLILKPLFIRPEGFFDRVKAAFGYDDIDFESAEFSKRFFVKSPDRKWAYDVIHARTMEYLLSAPRHSLEFDDRSIIVWNNDRWNSREFAAAADVVHGVLDRLPDYVLEQQRSLR